jgi:hypothetical protein
MKKLAVTALAVLLAFSATAFQASLETQKSVAEPSSPAEFSVNIENQQASNNSYSISLLSPKSSWFYYPNTVRVPGFSNRSFDISVSPINNSIQQRYRFDLRIRESSSGETEQLTGFFNVEQPYRVQITSLEKNKETFSPGEVVNTRITIRNLDNLQLENYQVRAEYGNETRTESGTAILPGGERRYSFNFQVDEDASPGQRQVLYTVEVDGEVERRVSQTVTVEEISNLSRNTTQENRILTYTETNSVRNLGNSPANATINADLPSYLSSITSTEPEARSEKVEEKTVFTWERRLQPGETFSASHTVKYWIPALALSLLVAGLLAIKRLGNDVKIRKNTAEVNGEIKVNIEIENRSGKTLGGLEMEEFIPDIATVDETFDMNAPKIRKTSEGTKLNWKIDLEPGDQRIIQYKIKPKVEVEEEVELQKTVLKDSNGQKIAESNRSSEKFRPDTT